LLLGQTAGHAFHPIGKAMKKNMLPDPRGELRVVAGGYSALFADLMSDHATDDGATDSAGSTATRQHGATNRSGAGTDRRVFTLRQAGTSAQRKRQGHANGNKQEFLGIFHGTTSL